MDKQECIDMTFGHTLCDNGQTTVYQHNLLWPHCNCVVQDYREVIYTNNYLPNWWAMRLVGSTFVAIIVSFELELGPIPTASAPVLVFRDSSSRDLCESIVCTRSV